MVPKGLFPSILWLGLALHDFYLFVQTCNVLDDEFTTESLVPFALSSLSCFCMIGSRLLPKSPCCVLDSVAVGRDAPSSKD